MAAGKYSEVYLPSQVIAEVAYVLEGIHKYSSINKLSKLEIKGIIEGILNTPKVKCKDENLVRKALDFYVKKNIPFGDAIIVSDVIENGINEILTFDRDFEGIKFLKVIGG